VTYAPKLDSDEFFERVALSELRRLPAARWAALRGLWDGIVGVHPSTARRILADALRLCVERKETPPHELSKLADQLLLSGQPRDRPRTPAKQIRAAWLKVREPGISNSALARRVDVSKPTVADWLAQDRFAGLLREVQARRNVRIAGAVYGRYVEKFGDTFEWSRPPTFVPLSAIVPLMEAALAGGQSVTTAMVDQLRCPQ